MAPKTFLLGSALIVLIAFSGCTEGSGTTTAAVTVRDSAGVRIIQNRSVALTPACALDLAGRVVIGRDDAVPGHDLYRVRGGAVLTDGRIALLNAGSHQLRFFSPAGDLVSLAAGQGEGPGELQRPVLLQRLAADTLLVAEHLRWRYHQYDAEGGYIGSFQPRPGFNGPPSGGGVLQDHSMILPEAERWRDDFSELGLAVRRFRVDEDGADTLLSLSAGRAGTTTSSNFYIRPWFEPFVSVAVRGMEILTGDGSEAEFRIHSVEETALLTAIVRWDAGDRTITNEIREEAREHVRRQYPGGGSEEDLREMYLSADRPSADLLPAYATLTVGTDGATWVRGYDAETNSGASEWLRFSPDGRLECAVDLGASTSPLEFGSDYVLRLSVDELGVESVDVAGIVRPATSPN